MKYLSIQLVGHERIVAFESENKENDKQPDYKGDGVAVWINEAHGKSDATEQTKLKSRGNGW